MVIALVLLIVKENPNINAGAKILEKMCQLEKCVIVCYLQKLKIKYLTKSQKSDIIKYKKEW